MHSIACHNYVGPLGIVSLFQSFLMQK